VWPTVILLDLRMPTMDGWDLLEVLDRDRRLAAIPRVVITGERGHGLGDHARTSVLLKPFASADLVREIWRWCDRVAA
jgi:CheY-like chemotaxis protein